MNNKPGIIGSTFYIKFSSNWHKKGSIIRSGISNYPLEVINVYKRTWLRRFLAWLGFKTKLFTCKVKIIDERDITN